MKIIRLFLSGTGMAISLVIFFLGGLIHLGLFLSLTPVSVQLNSLFTQNPVLAIFGILAGIFEGVGGAWFIFFLLHQTIRPALLRLCLFFLFLVAATYGSIYFFTSIATVTQLVRGFALAFGTAMALPLFFFDLLTSLITSAVKTVLPHPHHK